MRQYASWRAQVLWDPRDMLGGNALQTAPPAPGAPKPPPDLPDPMGEEALKARRTQAKLDAARPGRAATMLTKPAMPLASGDYTAKTLGT